MVCLLALSHQSILVIPMNKISQMFDLPKVNGGGAESSTYSRSSCPLSSVFSLACGLLGAFLFHLSKGSDSEKLGFSRLLVMWSWKATEATASLLLALDVKPCKIYTIINAALYTKWPLQSRKCTYFLFRLETAININICCLNHIALAK